MYTYIHIHIHTFSIHVSVAPRRPCTSLLMLASYPRSRWIAVVTAVAALLMLARRRGSLDVWPCSTAYMCIMVS